MKKIYTISLDDDIPLSNITASDVKEIAYCLFEEIDKYDRKILVVDDDKTLFRNQLYETYVNGEYRYRFESENSSISNYRYEPFLINDRSFGFTVYDEAISENEILAILNGVLAFLSLRYSFNINGIYYKDDIANGRMAIFKHFKANNSNNTLEQKQNVKVKKRILPRPILSMFNI